MVRPTDQEVTAFEKIVRYTHRSQEKGACHTIVGHTGKYQDHTGGRG